MAFPFTVVAEARVPLPRGADAPAVGALLAHTRRDLVERYHAEDLRRIGDAVLEFRREPRMGTPLAMVDGGTVRVRLEPGAAVFAYDLRLALVAVWAMAAAVAVCALVLYRVTSVFLDGGRWLAPGALAAGLVLAAASHAYYYRRAARAFPEILARACLVAARSRAPARPLDSPAD